MHVDHDAACVAGDGGDEQVLHQPAILFVAGFEFRRGAAIDQLGIDRLVALELLQQVERPEADALVLDIDHRPVGGLEGVFRFQLDQLIGPDDLEIRAERINLAVDLTADIATDDRDDAANAVADLARADDIADQRSDGEDIFGFERWCHEKTPVAERKKRISAKSASAYSIYLSLQER